MEINEFAKPFVPNEKFSVNQIGSQFNSFEIGKKWKNSIIICGLSSLKGDTQFLNSFREILYSLSAIDSKRKLIDLGNVISLSENDRREALQIVLKEARNLKATLLLFGDDSFSFKLPPIESDKTNQHIIVCPSISEDDLDFLSKANSSVTYVGVQSYFNSLEVSKKKVAVDFIPLGQVRDDIMDIEPYYRMSSRAIFNLSAIRKSDYSQSYQDSPNGLYAEEICQLGWFAGNSDTIDVYSITNLNAQNDSKSDNMMVAQLFWYILTGITKRFDDNPSKNTRNFKEYYIENNKIPEDLVFYKSMTSDKFWVKYGQDEIYIPCSKKDMNVVLEGNLSDRLLKKIAVNQKKQ